MATCWSCSKVKGRRVCPARGGSLICSKCCGTKRKVEIDCPADCSYLHGADPNWQSANRQREDARFLSRFLSLNEEQVMFLLFTHHLLLSARRRFTALSDAQLEEVISTSAKTLDTHTKGIVYSHKSSSPHLDPLSEWLTRVIAARSKIATAPDVSDSTVVEVLEAIGRAIKDHVARPGKTGGYLVTAEVVLQSSLGDAPKIELPNGIAPLGDSPSDLIVPP